MAFESLVLEVVEAHDGSAAADGSGTSAVDASLFVEIVDVRLPVVTFVAKTTDSVASLERACKAAVRSRQVRIHVRHTEAHEVDVLYDSIMYTIPIGSIAAAYRFHDMRLCRSFVQVDDLFNAPIELVGITIGDGSTSVATNGDHVTYALGREMIVSGGSRFTIRVSFAMPMLVCDDSILAVTLVSQLRCLFSKSGGLVVANASVFSITSSSLQGISANDASQHGTGISTVLSEPMPQSPLSSGHVVLDGSTVSVSSNSFLGLLQLVSSKASGFVALRSESSGCRRRYSAVVGPRSSGVCE